VSLPTRVPQALRGYKHIPGVLVEEFIRTVKRLLGKNSHLDR